MTIRTQPDAVRPFRLDFAPMRKLRKGEEITLLALATAAGIDKITLWRVENNRSKPQLHTLIALSRALGVPMHQLYTVTDRP